jgi:hypothetical protein
MKKAQLTPFILLGVIILIAFMVMFYLTSFVISNNQHNQALVFNKATVDNYVTTCLDKVSSHALTILGKQGGHIYPQHYLETPNYYVSYLSNNGVNDVPSIEQMQKELSAYINENLNSLCLENFEPFKKQRWDVSYGDIKITTSINVNSVTFDLKLPVTIKHDESYVTAEDFTVTHKLRLMYIWSTVNRIVNSLIENSNWIDMTLLSDFDLEFTIFPYNKVPVFSITDEKYHLNQKPYQFMFAITS